MNEDKTNIRQKHASQKQPNKQTSGRLIPLTMVQPPPPPPTTTKISLEEKMLGRKFLVQTLCPSNPFYISRDAQYVASHSFFFVFFARGGGRSSNSGVCFLLVVVVSLVCCSAFILVGFDCFPILSVNARQPVTQQHIPVFPQRHEHCHSEGPSCHPTTDSPVT